MIMKVADIPSDALEALERVRSVIPDAVIAGGFLRDLDNGYPFTDVDVFFESCVDDIEDQMNEVDKALGNSGTKHWVYKFQEYRKWNNTLIGVRDFTFRGYTVQLTGLEMAVDMKNAADRCDMGLCQIATDGKDLYKSKNYKSDKTNHWFSYDPMRQNFSGHENTIKRWQRLQKRYTDWPLLLLPSQF